LGLEEFFLPGPKSYQAKVIASSGQLSTHTPHSTHSSASATVDLSSFITRTSLGQSSTQDPHPVHFSASITGGILFTSFSVKWTFVPSAGIEAPLALGREN
jgi:hypothetical protein